MYRRLRCMKIFLLIYLVALKRAIFCSADVTRSRARADVKRSKCPPSDWQHACSLFRNVRTVSVSIHVAGRPRLPPALLSVRLHSSSSAQTAGTCAALQSRRM